MLMLVDLLLNWYLELSITKDMAGIIKHPREFGAKLALATAFGLPLVFGQVLRHINLIRNSMAHKSTVLNASSVEELGRHVNKLTQIDNRFKPLAGKFMELGESNHRILYGTGDVRADFYMATMAFNASMFRWGSNHEKQKLKTTSTE